MLQTRVQSFSRRARWVARLRSTWLCMLCALVLSACTNAGLFSTAAQSPAPATPAPSVEEPAAAPAPDNASNAEVQATASQSVDKVAALVDDQPQPCAALASGVGVAAQRQATSDPKNVRYDDDKNTIMVRKGAELTLGDVARSLNQADVLQELTPGEWLLSANLRVEKGATLRIAEPEVRRLKLRSDDKGFVWIKAFGGRLEFTDVCVTSWDVERQTVDENYDDGRSFVLARDGATMTIRNAELSYLGYGANESYGVAWRLAGTGGEIVNSRLGHNFYGLYTYQVSDLVIRGNEVHHSVRYGIDPHTNSNRLLIEDNVSHHNGKHGIILANGCADSIIRNNKVYNNAMHGIVLYLDSNNNVVEGNTSYGNGFEGFNVNDSSGNTIRNNTAYDNARSGIGVGQEARNNLVVGNRAHNNREDGIALYSQAAENTLLENEIHHNGRYGINVKSGDNRIGEGNRVFENAVGLYLQAQLQTEVSLEHNQIYGNREADVRTRD